jgi:hypothetical protein
MHEDYCFKCGCWARLDDASKLCGPCYDAWPTDGRRADDALGAEPEQAGEAGAQRRR